MIAAPILYFIGTVAMDVIVAIDDINSGIYYLGGDIFIATLTLVACLSYAKHSKNIMKAVIGALLVYTCIITINLALAYTIYFDAEYDTALDVVFAVARAVLAITFFVDHLVLAANHKASAVAIKLNLIVALLFAAVSIAWEVYAVIFFGNSILYAVAWVFANVGLVSLVMCIESKIDYFKQQRDEREKAAEEEAEAEVEAEA